MSLLAAVRAELDRMAACGETAAYGDLARRLAVPGPGSIARLTEALEQVMAEDAAAGLPLRAALCTGRMRGGLPAPGFFAAARRLGCHEGPDEGPHAEAFVMAQRRELFARAHGL